MKKTAIYMMAGLGYMVVVALLGLAWAFKGLSILFTVFRWVLSRIPLGLEAAWPFFRWAWRRIARAERRIATRQRRRMGQLGTMGRQAAARLRRGIGRMEVWFVGAWAFRRELCLEMR